LIVEIFKKFFYIFVKESFKKSLKKITIIFVNNLFETRVIDL